MCNWYVKCIVVLSLPEPKAPMSFSDQNLSFVRRCRWRCRKLFTVSSSSLEPLGQFQPNLAQSILGWRGCSNGGPAIFLGEIITKKRKYIGEIKKKFFSSTAGPISTKLDTMHPWMKGTQVCSNEEPFNSHEVNLLLINTMIIICGFWFELFF